MSKGKLDGKQLVRDGESVYTCDGEYLFTISMTTKQKQLLNDDDWDKKKESWIEYKRRAKPLWDAEREKRHALLDDIVNAYNETRKGLYRVSR